MNEKCPILLRNNINFVFSLLLDLFLELIVCGVFTIYQLNIYLDCGVIHLFIMPTLNLNHRIEAVEKYLSTNNI